MLTSAQGRARRRKGKTGEREFRKWLIAHGIPAERVSECEGDIVIGTRFGPAKIEVRRTTVALPEARRVFHRAHFLAQRLDRQAWRIWTSVYLSRLWRGEGHDPAEELPHLSLSNFTWLLGDTRPPHFLIIFPDAEEWAALCQSLLQPLSGSS